MPQTPRPTGLSAFPPVMRAAAIYFLIVFGAGFAFGVVRVPLAVPLIGERTAELLEMPLMLGVMVLAARWLVQRYAERLTMHHFVGVGVLCAVAVVVADFAVGMGLRGMTAAQVVLDRDPVSGTVYCLLVLVCAGLPVWLRARRR